MSGYMERQRDGADILGNWVGADIGFMPWVIHMVDVASVLIIIFLCEACHRLLLDSGTEVGIPKLFVQLR